MAHTPVSRSRQDSKPSGLARRHVAARGPPSDGESFLIVAIGASAGGLEACSRLLDAGTDLKGMALVVVQHLDPNHDSLLVDLLSSHTHMSVKQAVDGDVLAADHLFIIPPASYLSVAGGVLHLSKPDTQHGARLPFDFLLRSLAEVCATRSVGVVLSGTGSDGSEGLRVLKEKGGLTIAQDPEDAEYDGMPQSAIATGAVDLTLKIEAIPGALEKHSRGELNIVPAVVIKPDIDDGDSLAKVIEILRSRTMHDFTLYKQGTLRRRIERRMAMGDKPTNDMTRYIELLNSDPDEVENLAKDLFINVTSFFRDTKVFDYLEKTVIPDLVRGHQDDQPLRIWIAGCSTGEEAYSLAMLLRDETAASKRNLRVQIFASDIDADAVAIAREGLYPEAIAADVSKKRLEKFFSKESNGFKVCAELRASVVFTVQDVLSDPPFSKIDFISCRNLFIYFGMEAQAKAVALFHFALRQGGLLLLGNSETAGHIDGRFELVSKAERLYRHIGRARPGQVGFTLGKSDGRAPNRAGAPLAAQSRNSDLAEFARRMALKIYAPALVIINRKMECLYFLGATDRYLHRSEGHPTNDLLGMLPQEARIKLRAAVQQAGPASSRVRIEGVKLDSTGKDLESTIEVHLIQHDGDELLLVGFIDVDTKTISKVPVPDANAKKGKARKGAQVHISEHTRATELERELDVTRTELHAAIRNLELSGEEQKAVNEEALSVNEEFQSTNEELLTSKEELQSLNEELTALNHQLQETLDRQRTTSNDLQNVLYSTDVATLFLDMDLNIRFFTPATKSLFNVIPGDVGRPLADLRSLASDTDLPADAHTVMEDLRPIDREIEIDPDHWFNRRILPYRNHENRVEGVVITFTDISERKRIRKALEKAKVEADQANRAKSRFLAAASHDLRQPLQTISFVQGLLARTVEGEKAQNLVKRLDDTLHAMSGMLNALLDINQIEAGVVRADVVQFSINEMFERLRQEFTYHAQAKSLVLKVVPCTRLIHTDPRLLEQVLRNLLTNAIKYTRSGKVLLGCRRRTGSLSIEIWDTGIGIPDSELQTIFEEYHQIDNTARESSRGLGLGLYIVQRLATLLGCKVQVRSKLGKGSVFAIEIAMPLDDGDARIEPPSVTAGETPSSVKTGQRREILVVEDDPDVRELLALLLEAEGHHVTTASDGSSAIGMVAKGALKPDLVIADYNLPREMDGLQVASNLRIILNRHLPVVILTGDISTRTLSEIARSECVHLNKPVKLRKMVSVVDTLLQALPSTIPAVLNPTSETVMKPSSDTVYVVDDDHNIRDTMQALLEGNGYTVATFPTCEAFVAGYHSEVGGCLLIDAYLPGMDGFALLQRLKDSNDALPAIMITGNSDVPMAVQAMKAGAIDFIEKPVSSGDLLASIGRAFEKVHDVRKMAQWHSNARLQIAGLTARQREIMDLVLAGHPSKNIAADLGISQRTVENHRNAIMTRTGCKSLPALVRLALAAAPPKDH